MAKKFEIDKETFEEITKCAICFSTTGPKCSMCPEGHTFCYDCLSASNSYSRRKICPTCRCELETPCQIRPRTYEFLLARLQVKCEICSGAYDANHRCAHILKLNESIKLQILWFLGISDISNFGIAKNVMFTQLTALQAFTAYIPFIEKKHFVYGGLCINPMKKINEFRILFDSLYKLQVHLKFGMCISGSFAYYVYNLISSKFINQKAINNLRRWEPNDVDIYIPLLEDGEDFPDLIRNTFGNYTTLVIPYPENDAFQLSKKDAKTALDIQKLLNKPYDFDEDIKRITDVYFTVPLTPEKYIIGHLLKEPEKHKKAINQLVLNERLTLASLNDEFCHLFYPKKLFKIQFIEHAKMKRVSFHILKKQEKAHRFQIQSMKLIWKKYDIQDLKVGIATPTVYPPSILSVILDDHNLQFANMRRGAMELVKPIRNNSKRVIKYGVQRCYKLYHNPHFSQSPR